MASIVSYIGSLPPSPNQDEQNALNPSSQLSWDGNKDFCENLVKYDLAVKVRCVLDQLLGIAYYHSFYGRRCHEVINEYVDDLILYTKMHLIPDYKKVARSASQTKLVNAIESLVQFITTGSMTNDVDIATVKEYLDVTPIYQTPSVWKDSHYYVPYLMWLNKNVQPGFINFVDKEKLGIIGFHFNNVYNVSTEKVSVVARNYSIGVSFSTKETPLDTISKDVSILAYLSHFDLSTTTVESLIGAVGELCLHLDVRRPGLNRSQILSACIMSNVMGLGDLWGSCCDYSTDMERYKYGLFKAFSIFLNFAYTSYNLKPASVELMARTFSSIAENKTQRDAAAYIRMRGGSASADQLSPSNEGLDGLEALQFISQSPALLSAQSQAAGSVVDAAGDDEKKENKPESTKEAKPAEEKQPEKSEEKSKDEKSEGDDTTKEETQSSDDTSEDIGDTPGDDSTGESDSGETPASGEDGAATGSDDMPEPNSDPEPNTSDEVGFVFKVSNPDSETTDSVMFREELNNYLSNILANPPEDLSPQNIATLNNLKQFWLFTLSIETIMGIVSSCLKRLPDSLTKLNTQCEVNNNE